MTKIVQAYEGATKFRPNKLLLTNHRTSDWSNLMSLVKGSVLNYTGPKFCRTDVCSYVAAMEGTLITLLSVLFY